MNIRPCWWICFKQSTPGRKILLLHAIIIWRMGILKVDDSCKGTLEWNLPKQIWHITLYKSTIISGQISSRSFVTPIFTWADLGSASATVPEMFPTPRAGQSMKIFVLIKKGSGLTDARLWVRSCEYLQWTFHCFRRMLLRHVFPTGFSTLLVWALCKYYVFSIGSGGGSPSRHTRKTRLYRQRQVISNVDFNYQGSLIAWGTGAGWLLRVLACLFFGTHKMKVPRTWESWSGLKNEICVFFGCHHNISRTTDDCEAFVLLRHFSKSNEIDGFEDWNVIPDVTPIAHAAQVREVLRGV